MYAQLLAIVVLFVVGCYGTNGRPHICPLPTEPCRLSVVMKTMDNLPLSEYGTQVCSCNGGSACPSDWSRSEYVIRRKLISDVNKITLKMMFCQPIQADRLCIGDEIALVTTGSLHMANGNVTVNCKCQGNRPLHLHRRTTNREHLNEESYMCSKEKPFCSSRDNCMQMDMEGQVVTYPCKCRRTLSCQQDRSQPWPIVGTCQTPPRPSSVITNLV